MSQETQATIQKYQELDKKLEQMTNDKSVNLNEDELEMLITILKLRKNGTAKASVDTVTDGKNFNLILSLAAEDGFCYLNLLNSLKGLNNLTQKTLLKCCQNMKITLGKNASGTSILEQLTSAQRVFLGEISPDDMSSIENVSDANRHIDILSEIMKSKACYQYTENGGVFHISNPSRPCECNEILCDHGWSTRYILTFMTRPGTLVGASEFDIDFDALFQSVPIQNSSDDLENILEEVEITDDETMLPIEPVNTMEFKSKKELGEEFDKMQQDLETEINFLKAKKNTEQGENNRAKRKIKNQLKEHGFEDCKTMHDIFEKVNNEIGPDDSSSNFGRYNNNKGFLKHGTVFSVRNQKTVEEMLPEVAPLQRNYNYKFGFSKTREMINKENKSLGKLKHINGLAGPCKSSRLNFLIHFHTAISMIDGETGMKPFDILKKLSQIKSYTPTEELMKQVILRTFDFNDLVILTNPFKLPFIEIGMVITDSCLSKCFVLLRNEYETLWFQEFKCLKIPKFHSRFENANSKEVTRFKPITSKDQDSRELVARQRTKPARAKTILGLSL